MNTTLPITFDREMNLPSLGLSLDSTRRTPFGFVSHAHSDHLAAHSRVISSVTGWLLISQRLAAIKRTVPAALLTHQLAFDDTEMVTGHVALPFGQCWHIRDHSVELLPAGHILGSAQLYVTFPSGSTLLYTGDVKLRSRPCVETARFPHADILVIESTFGRPQYQFPEWQDCVSLLHDRALAMMAEGIVPVFTAYPVGKAQEATLALSAANLPAAVHPSIVPYHRIYESSGFSLGTWEPLQENTKSPGPFIVPPAWSRPRLIALLAPFLSQRRYRTIFLSGWALDHEAPRHQADEALPLSDHADWDELREIVRLVQPQRVCTVHGFREFATYLNNSGIEASHHAIGRSFHS
ncbi:MAG: hypothetical protein M1118_01290 [Chloroflexi bacterium]|nr:hypothetical protein [Chloroflexota bacterium]